MARSQQGGLFGVEIVQRDECADLAEYEHTIGLLRATQEVRTAQSTRSFPFVAACVVLLWVDLYNVVPNRLALIGYGIALISLAMVRLIVSKMIQQGVRTATSEQLAANESWLFWTAVANSFTLGSGFWLVAGPPQATFDISLASCLYAIAAMVNASVRSRSFFWSIGANMGQGVLYSFALGPTFEPFLGFLLLAVLAGLAGFGTENDRRFAESYRIREENNRLVRQLATEKRVVEHALARAHEAAEQQGRFLASASHDLRQPLHAMMLYLEPLLEQVKGQSAEKIVNRLIESTDLLASQLSDMLDLSKLDAGAVKVHETTLSLVTFLERLAADTEPSARQKGLKLVTEVCDADVSTDPVLLDRVVRNLLSNAVRYTEKGEVRLKAVEDGDRVRISVKDTGPGIAEADAGRIFEDFVQLENPARARARGVGLGLANVRRISQLMNLDLQLQSNVGEGSEFIFWIPRIDEPTSTREIYGDPEISQEGIEVWAVEDDPNVSTALELQLRTLGCRPKMASCDQDVRQLADGGKLPQLVLIDDMLEEGVSGLEIAKWLRSERLSSATSDGTQIVLLTGNADVERLEAIRQSGFRLLQKPLRPGELKSLLSRVAAPAT